MALINCPECNKEISDKCEVCIHCGYPISSNIIKQNTICSINEKSYDLSFFLQLSKPDAFEKFLKITNCSIYEAKKITDEIFSTGKIPKTMTLNTMKKNDIQPSVKQQLIPKCPTCQSTNIRKVSATSKTVSVGLFGIFSQKVKKQFHCCNCGYEW